MVFSVKANRKKIFALLIVVIIAVSGIIIVPKLIGEPKKFYGETPTERKEFLSSFGLVAEEEPLQVREVCIPEKFSEVYTKYNDMQRAQGFDLRPYKSKVCRQYVYLLKNYPGTDKEVHATILIYNGIIIGGDVSCPEADGFMKGFAMDSEYYGGASSPESSGTSESSEQSSDESLSDSTAETAAETETGETESVTEDETAAEPEDYPID